VRGHMNEATQTPGTGVLLLRVALTEAEARALARLTCRVSRSKLKQFRFADSNEEARHQGLALDTIKAA